jgi:hypothetical protein
MEYICHHAKLDKSADRNRPPPPIYRLPRATRLLSLGVANNDFFNRAIVSCMHPRVISLYSRDYIRMQWVVGPYGCLVVELRLTKTTADWVINKIIQLW